MTLSRLVDQAVAIVREVAIGSMGVAPVLIALPDGKPVVLFLDVDDDSASQEAMDFEIDGFLARYGADTWLLISLADQTDLIRCTVHDQGLEHQVLLRPVHGASGLIADLEVFPVIPPTVYLPCSLPC